MGICTGLNYNPLHLTIKSATPLLLNQDLSLWTFGIRSWFGLSSSGLLLYIWLLPLIQSANYLSNWISSRIALFYANQAEFLQQLLSRKTDCVGLSSAESSAISKSTSFLVPEISISSILISHLHGHWDNPLVCVALLTSLKLLFPFAKKLGHFLCSQTYCPERISSPT